MNKEERLKFFQKRRTELLSKMLDNPDKIGIYPTSEFFKALDALVMSLIRHESILFAGEFAYRTANPNSNMDVPSLVYESAEKFYDNKYNKENE